MVDVYLASRHTAEILSLTHVLEGGWLASIPWEHSLTYGDLCDLKREFPVSNVLCEGVSFESVISLSRD